VDCVALVSYTKLSNLNPTNHIIVAKVMHVSERTVYRYAERFRVTGDVRPSVKRNGPAQLLCDFEELLLIQLILAHSGIYLRELQQLLYHSTVAGLMLLQSAEQCIG